MTGIVAGPSQRPATIPHPAPPVQSAGGQGLSPWRVQGSALPSYCLFAATLLVLTACSAPSRPEISVSCYQPPLTGRSDATVMALSADDQRRIEADLLRGGWIHAGRRTANLTGLPAWDEAAQACPIPPFCRLWPHGTREHDHVMVDLRDGRHPAWLLLLPLVPERPMADVLDGGINLGVVRVEP